jgi:hypothetical protein
MPETLEDVKSWLEAGVKALFPFDADTISALRYAEIAIEHGDLSPIQSAINRLQHRLDTYKIKIEEEYLTIGPFSICRTEWAGTGETVAEDGSTEADKEEGFLLEIAVPIRGTRDTPPDVDVAEVGKFPTAGAVRHRSVTSASQ